MRYEVVESRGIPSEWRVEAIKHPPEGDGECYVTIFSGPNSKERAKEYAALLKMHHQFFPSGYVDS